MRLFTLETGVRKREFSSVLICYEPALSLTHDRLHLTACTPESAPGPTLGNEYGKTLPLPFTIQYQYRTWYFWPMRVSTQMASPLLTMLTRTQTTDMRMACISLG